MPIKPVDDKLKRYLSKHQLLQKFSKQVKILEISPRHPSLHVELMEPKADGVYSFRIDRKYRALFIMINAEIEIVDVNDHYQ